MGQVRYRHGKAADIARARPLLEPDRRLYSPEIWPEVPRMLSDLLARGRIRICVFENAESGEMVCFGVTSFVRPGFLDATLEEGDGLAEAALRAESSRRPAFLNQKQVAQANRCDDLRAFTFFGAIPGNDLSDPVTLNVLVAIMDGWTFFHRGFSLAELWFEPATQGLAQSMANTGMSLLRERELAGGGTGQVYRLMRSHAKDLMPNWPAWVMFTPPPRFGFRRGEQSLLELALLDYSDRDAAEAMGVSAEAVKKRWRSIYARVSRVEPALCRVDLSGPDQRRDLLHTLRNNLQEIRPY